MSLYKYEHDEKSGETEGVDSQKMEKEQGNRQPTYSQTKPPPAKAAEKIMELLESIAQSPSEQQKLADFLTLNAKCSNTFENVATLLESNSDKAHESHKDHKDKETKTSNKHGTNADDQLPDSIKSFTCLRDMPLTRRALSDPAFLESQTSVCSKPNNDDALSVLRESTDAVISAYKEQISICRSDMHLAQRCYATKEASKAFFDGVYQEVWNMIKTGEGQDFKVYRQTVKDIKDNSIVPVTTQVTKDCIELFQHAARIRLRYRDWVTSAFGSFGSCTVSIPDKLKKMGRIIEKSLLKRKDEPGNVNRVFDVVRGMVQCENLSTCAKVVQHFHNSEEVSITRVKDRFWSSPSEGGWRDCMLNFFFKEDPHRHICELQIVHVKMMMARKGLPGHLVYSRCRNANEFYSLLDVTPVRDRKDLEERLIDWQKHREQSRWGHPNSWIVSRVTNMDNLFCFEKPFSTGRAFIESHFEEQSCCCSPIWIALRIGFAPIGLINYCRRSTSKYWLETFNDDISAWDVSNVKSMRNMFHNAPYFNKPIGSWDVSNVRSMEGMFRSARSFNQPIGDWNVSNVRDMNGMFHSATSFNQPIGEWDVSNVLNMGAMFSHARCFNQPIGEWDVSNAVTMSAMFSHASKFNQPIGSWKIHHGTYLNGMFFLARSFNQDISSWRIFNWKSTDNPVRYLLVFPEFLCTCHMDRRHRPRMSLQQRCARLLNSLSCCVTRVLIGVIVISSGVIMLAIGVGFILAVVIPIIIATSGGFSPTPDPVNRTNFTNITNSTRF